MNCARYVNAFNKGSEICDFVCLNILDILNLKIKHYFVMTHSEEETAVYVYWGLLMLINILVQ